MAVGAVGDDASASASGRATSRGIASVGSSSSNASACANRVRRSASSAADCGRLAGSLSRQRSTIAASSGGVFGAALRSGTGSSCTILSMTSATLSPKNGTPPDTSS